MLGRSVTSGPKPVKKELIKGTLKNLTTPNLQHEKSSKWHTLDTNESLCCSKVLSLTNLKYEKRTNNFPLEPGERRYISSTYTLVDV